MENCSCSAGDQHVSENRLQLSEQIYARAQSTENVDIRKLDIQADVIQKDLPTSTCNEYLKRVTNIASKSYEI